MQASDLSHPAAAPASGDALRPWHRAIRAQFFVLGGAMGAWGAQVPAVKEQYALDEQSLSVALLAAAGGAVLCLLTAGALVARFGVRRCVLVAGMLMCAALVGVLLSSHYGVLLSLMLLLGSMRAEERLAGFLINLSQRLNARGFSAHRFLLRMTREEIGSLLGLKLETVSRILSRFQAEGLIAVRNREVEIQSMPALRAVIGRGDARREREAA